MGKLFLILALIASFAVVSAPVADAHALRYGKAERVASNAMLQFVQRYESELGYGTFSPVQSSKRVSRHKWVFKYAFRFDGSSTTEGHCKVSVWYKNARSRSIRWRIYAIRVE